MKKISDGIYGVLTKLGFVNYYVLNHDDQLTVIDIGLGKGDVDRLERELQAHGWNLSQIQHILITHAHMDHTGGLAELQQRTNAVTYVHAADAAVVRGEESSPRANPEELGRIGRMILRFIKDNDAPPASVQDELQGGEQLDAIFPGLEVVHLPGHSPGQCGYYVPNRGLLIGGDVMMRYPWGLAFPIRAASPDWDAVQESIRKIDAMKLDILCLGHGNPILTNASEPISRFAALL